MGLLLKMALPYLITAGVVAGAYAWVTTGAYNRGVRDRDAEAVKIIAAEKKAAIQDSENVKRLSPSQLDQEIVRRCRESGGTEAQCGK